ncbi:MAG: hypothetical protein JW783_11010 [Bacteroidales bacterium]|nr:hypothetical protein [Bacteroidales bacterium]MBN2749048.1 hypothetical protein [Bacteroidales bacterium]
MLTIYEDKAFEQKTYKELQEGVIVLQTLVNEFNDLNLGNVEQDELGILIVNPRMLYDQRLAKIEIPSGFRRDKYLEIMELPSLSNVEQTRRNYKRFEMYGAAFYNLKNGKISVNTTKAKQHAEMHTISINENSPAYEVVKKLIDAIELINSINVTMDYSLLLSHSVKLDGLYCSLQGLTGQFGKNNVVINNFKIKQLIKEIERNHSKQQVKN